jgi:hypothetical protein
MTECAAVVACIALVASHSVLAWVAYRAGRESAQGEQRVRDETKSIIEKFAVQAGAISASTRRAFSADGGAP